MNCAALPLTVVSVVEAPDLVFWNFCHFAFSLTGIYVPFLEQVLMQLRLNSEAVKKGASNMEEGD